MTAISTRERSAAIVERCLLVVLLLYFLGGLVPTAHIEGHPSPTYDKIMVLCQVILFPPFLILAYRNRERIQPGIRAARWLFILCAWVLASSIWSYGHLYTLRRAVIFAVSTLFGVYLGSRFSQEEQIDIIGIALAVAVAMSLIVVAAFPKLGISQSIHSGQWRGVFMHKNTLGMTMAFTLLLFLVARPVGIPLLLRIFVILGAAAALYKSNSETAIFLGAAVPAVYFVSHLFRIRKSRTLPLWIAFVPAFAVAVIVLVAGASVVFDALGRDATLSGRTQLWDAALDAMRAHPIRQWIGYGYSVFWSERNPEMGDIFAQVGWFPVHGHNGYIDVYLDLGLVGLTIFIVGFVIGARRFFLLFLRANSAAEKWVLPCLIFVTLSNLTESQLLRAHMFLWIPFVGMYVSTTLRMKLQDERSWQGLGRKLGAGTFDERSQALA
jgi:exopolysaccharide production protein ExoQ